MQKFLSGSAVLLSEGLLICLFVRLKDNALNQLCFQGAPEGLIDRCQFIRVGTQKMPITPAIKAEIAKHVKFYGSGKAAVL